MFVCSSNDARDEETENCWIDNCTVGCFRFLHTCPLQWFRNNTVCRCLEWILLCYTIVHIAASVLKTIDYSLAWTERVSCIQSAVYKRYRKLVMWRTTTVDALICVLQSSIARMARQTLPLILGDAGFASLDTGWCVILFATQVLLDTVDTQRCRGDSLTWVLFFFYILTCFIVIILWKAD